jgi:hypothetical protein
MPTTVADLLNSEVARLNNRKVAIDEAEEERKRVLSFNTSATERQKAYNGIYLVIVVMLFVVVIIKMIYQFGLVPDAILDTLIAFVISAGLIYCLILYSDIIKRSNMDFSRLDLGTIPVKTETQKDSEIAAGNLSAVQGQSADGKCIGAACCTGDQTYNEVFSICVPNTISRGIVPTSPTPITLKYDLGDEITTYPDNDANTENPILTTEIVSALTDPANYKYCRISAGNYEWLPVTKYNLRKGTDGKRVRRVTEEDPNWIDATGDRKAYDEKSMTTIPFAQAFTTMESADIKPFVTDVVYTKYV